MQKKICLFTAHSPQTGGGAVILRSLIKHLPEYDIRWKYIAGKPAREYEEGYLGQGIMGGALLDDIKNTWLMLRGKKQERINAIVQNLLDTECDAYWVVSHNEGIRVAIELATLQNKRPVHMTVHDDWSGALSGRSVRYRFMAGMADKITIKAINTVNSVDVISRGMQAYYQQLAGRQSEVCHRYLPPEALKINATGTGNASQITVGHIGSLYDKQDFVNFLNLLQEFGRAKNKTVSVKMWGYHPKKKDEGFPGHLAPMVTINKDLPEELAIEELVKCDFVYSMYPFSKRLRIFSKTSLPTKLSTYVQCCRPIFAHGPAESTLAAFIQDTGTGVMWTSADKQAGFRLLETVTGSAPGSIDWEGARRQFFGEKNLETLKKVFG